ncbi:MAG: hypothetical protein AAF387_01195 [Pseudomonadota bacterium]
MISHIIGFAVLGIHLRFNDPLAADPFDLVSGAQVVELRQPLFNRQPGARLILYTKQYPHRGEVADSISAFKAQFPTGSVSARLQGSDEVQLDLKHTGYSFYRGTYGLVLTADEELLDTELFNTLNITSDVALDNVRAVWIDRGGRDIRDLTPSL